MKKLLLFAALVLGTVSCMKDNSFDANVGGEADVVLSVALPSDVTRAMDNDSSKGAIGNIDLTAEYDIRYILEVFDASNTLAKRVENYEDSATSTTFELRLIPGRHYSFVVWADFVAQGSEAALHYNAEDLRNIEIIGAQNAMDESRDAYTGIFRTSDNGGQPFSSSSQISFELKRPFAKLRVVTNDKDEIYSSLVRATIQYTADTYQKYDALTKKSSELETKTKSVDYTSELYLYAGEQTPGEDEQTLFADYILGTQDGTVQFIMTVEDSVQPLPAVNFNTAIPVQANYLTTIKGAILTDPGKITVEIVNAFENGSDWNPGDDNHDVEVWDGKSTKEPDTDDKGNYIIELPSELAWLADQVNGVTRAAANNFQGQTFKLTQDIDLGNAPWTPIGSNGKIFSGTFDGQGHKIANLVVNGYNSNAGLFGYTTDGEIKNFTLENAKVSGRLNVGAVAGQPYTTKYTNITVQGHVEINGMAYVGGVGGKNAYADWTNITVNVDETSYVKAHSIENGNAYRTYVGGVCGFNGEGGHKFTNITSNIDVLGSTCDVGGLFGIAHYGNQFENCSCSGNVEIYAAEEAEEAQEIGGIAGVWHNENGTSVEFANCVFEGALTTNVDGVNFYYGGLIGKPYSATGTGKLIIDGYEMVANGVGLKDGEYFVMSAQGLAWVEAQEDKYFAGKTIKLANDIDMTGVTIEKPIHFWGGRTTFDGQNYTISNLTMSTTSTEKKPFGLFGGTADIKNVKFDNANISGYSYVAVVAGNLYGNIENCHVSNSSVTCTYWMAGAMSGQYNAGNVTGCSVTNTTITGPAAVGALIGNINETAGERKVENCTITGCTVAQNSSFGGDYDKMFGTAVGLVNIENSKVYINGCKVEDTTVKGATSANIFGLSSDNTTIYVDDYTYTPDGIIKDENGNLIVNSLESLEAALETAGAAGAGDTTIVFAENAQLNMTGAEWTPIKVDGYNGADIVTIEGNGAVITGLEAPLFAGGFAGGSGIVIKDLTIKDSNIESANTIGSGAFIESVDSMAKIELTNCHLLYSTVTGGAGSRTGGLVGWTAGYSNQNDGPVKTYVTIDGCSVIGCTITCDGSVGGINGHAGNNDWTYTTIKNCTIKDNTLASTDDGGWRVGVVVGTANVGEVTISNITESGNTLTQTGKTAPVGFLRNLYGRAVLGTTGKLTIDGYKYVAEGLFEDANGNAVVGTQTALADALVAGKTNVTLTAGNYELYGLNFVANNVTLKGADKANVVLNLENSIYLQNKSVTLENLTYNLNAGKGYTEQAFAFVHHATAFNLKNCNVNRLRLNVYEANIEGCTFTLNTSSGFDGYCIYYYGNDNSTVNVKNSTFATAGKGICIYSEGAMAYNLNVDECSFTSSDSATDKAAIQMHTECGISGNVKITKTTATGFADINGGLWNELNNTTKDATDKFDIWVNGTQVH